MATDFGTKLTITRPP